MNFHCHAQGIATLKRRAQTVDNVPKRFFLGALEIKYSKQRPNSPLYLGPMIMPPYIILFHHQPEETVLVTTNILLQHHWQRTLS